MDLAIHVFLFCSALSDKGYSMEKSSAPKPVMPSLNNVDILEYEKKLKILEKENTEMSRKLSSMSPQDKLDGSSAFELKRLAEQVQTLSKQNKGRNINFY